mmetsp:Transcript_25800/g.58059  ORF Transcript_25800/g.58059 Transcript_25800/m.58059 type:complete len:281 (-) Transcript_25800:4252-5094(-)
MVTLGPDLTASGTAREMRPVVMPGLAELKVTEKSTDSKSGAPGRRLTFSGSTWKPNEVMAERTDLGNSNDTKQKPTLLTRKLRCSCCPRITLPKSHTYSVSVKSCVTSSELSPLASFPGPGGAEGPAAEDDRMRSESPWESDSLTLPCPSLNSSSCSLNSVRARLLSRSSSFSATSCIMHSRMWRQSASDCSWRMKGLVARNVSIDMVRGREAPVLVRTPIALPSLISIVSLVPMRVRSPPPSVLLVSRPSSMDVPSSFSASSSRRANLSVSWRGRLMRT